MTYDPNDILCGNCMFWDGKRDGTEQTLGDCRVRSPRVVGEGRTAWPRTKLVDWCGKFASEKVSR